MPVNLQPSQPPSHAQTLRGVQRRLSRSPHPYHKQNSELQYASERFPSDIRSSRADSNAGDEDHDSEQSILQGSREMMENDSGTEADDEHFLKGLPAPKLRSHKGLRGQDGALSGSPSPLASPAHFSDEQTRAAQVLKKTCATMMALDNTEASAIATKIRHKKISEIVRRATEAGILVVIGGTICMNGEVRNLLLQWKRELCCQILVVLTLLILYPLRVLSHTNPGNPFARPWLLEIPVSFDPAPLFYPPAISMLVSILICVKKPDGLLPSIILAIASLPRDLIPSFGNLESSNLVHWLLSTLPLLTSMKIDMENSYSDPETLVLLASLHSATCETLHYLTTTSLLPAELHLLSLGLIVLFLLASSPQAVILKALLWGCGLGLLITCTHVLKWGVSLARVPKWRFRRAGSQRLKQSFGARPSPFRRLSASLFSRDVAVGESSDVVDTFGRTVDQSRPPPLNIFSGIRRVTSIPENGSQSEVELPSVATDGNEEFSFTHQRRHTMSTLPARSNQKTPSGRRKRSASSSVQAFFNLTQAQATARKWIYAGYVYLCVAIIILFGIREYVQRFALHGSEPVGWALGYMFGDNPWFRMQVITTGLQPWICLRPRSEADTQNFCQSGWVENLRHESFGTANTRLILSAYWLAIIIVGLAIVLRLSSIYEVDTRRKVFHFMMVAMLLPATYVDPAFAALALSLMLVIFLLLDLFRASQLPPLSKSLAYFLTPYVDGRDLKGPVVISHIFLLIGCAIPLWLSLGTLPRSGTSCLAGWELPTREVSMVSGVICVGLGDAAASLVGRRYGRRKWLWGGGKSIEGSVAFATAVGLALVLAKIWLRIGGWPANNDDSWTLTIGKAGVAAWVASLTEAALTGGNDNVVCPIILWLCAKGLDI
ncbi:cytidylyltransferase [Calycina marina]|uniref:dolichol kinase n=1 Tax=Calycina marina TaxID=1763456 RepID=A0A9P7Z6F5_9HELO|nr:cytidylyltransferase [Calycina marina]